MRRVFIARHGNTFSTGEVPRRIGNRTDPPLVASGVEQAVALGQWFAKHNVTFAQAYAGPLLRTSQTAAIILQRTCSEAVLAPADWLAEIDHGPDENKPEPEVRQRLGDAALAVWDTEGVPPPGWQVDVEQRRKAWRRGIDALGPGDALLVTSNGAARMVFAAIPSLGPPGSMKLRTGAVGVLVEENDRWQLVGWDRRPTPDGLI